MKPENLISIGEFAKFTEVDVQSIRYYEKLGIFRPAWVNPDSGYRYYSVVQADEIFSIQKCVQHGIPLKHYQAYIMPNGAVNYEGLWGQVQSNITQQIESLRVQQSILDGYLHRMSHVRHIRDGEEPTLLEVPARTLWVVPFDDVFPSEAFFAEYQKQVYRVRALGLSGFLECGFVLLKREGRWTKHFMLELPDVIPEGLKGQRELIRLPAGQCLCKKLQRSDIWQFRHWAEVRGAEVDYVVERKLFAKEYHQGHPPLELQCGVGWIKRDDTERNTGIIQ